MPPKIIQVCRGIGNHSGPASSAAPLQAQPLHHVTKYFAVLPWPWPLYWACGHCSRLPKITPPCCGLGHYSGPASSAAPLQAQPLHHVTKDFAALPWTWTLHEAGGHCSMRPKIIQPCRGLGHYSRPASSVAPLQAHPYTLSQRIWQLCHGLGHYIRPVGTEATPMACRQK